ncbi:TorF family putative porin [Luteibacter jiangsuensis]
MKIVLLAACAAAFPLVCSAPAHAADAPPVTGNVAIVSDYMFRGLTQTWGHPAIQGGADYTAASGFSAGTWASSVSDRSYAGGSMELDLYASFGRPIDDDWSWRVGVYGYVYPGANLDQAAGYRGRSFNTVEANAALTWRYITLKYNRSLTDYFGADHEQGYTGDTRGTGYLQLDATFALADAWSLALHAGHTHYTASLATPTAYGVRNVDYSDASATVKYTIDPHWSVSVGVTHATNGRYYSHVSSYTDAADTRDVGGTRGLIMFQGTF